MENTTGHRIKRVRADNGLEFINVVFRKELDEAGIIHEKTAAYTPELNGQAELLNGSLAALVRAMLKDSGSGKEL